MTGKGRRRSHAHLSTWAAWAVCLGLLWSAGSAGNALAWGADGAGGPASQQEAEAWLKQVYGWVEQAAGFAAQAKQRPRILLATPKQAGKMLRPELAAAMPQGPGAVLPEAAELGSSFLTPYVFAAKTILLIPANLKEAEGAEKLNAEERMQVLKIVLARACDLALLDSYYPLGRVYYQAGNSDPALARRGVWEGHARAVQRKLAQMLGVPEAARRVALANSFTVERPLAATASGAAQRARFVRQARLDRLCEVGLEFNAVLRKARGPKGILEALQKPPLRTAQLLVPQDYLEGRGYTPSDPLLGETLARAVGRWFPPQTWENESRVIGALSLQGGWVESLWKAGRGPLAVLQESFDMDYIAGRNLAGKRRDGKSARGAAIHVFRSPEAAHRFMKWHAAHIPPVYRSLAVKGVGVKKRAYLGRKALALPARLADALDEVFGLLATLARPNGKPFTDAHYYFRKGSWVLLMDLDLAAEPQGLAVAARELLHAVSASAKKPPQTPPASGKK